MLNYCIYLYSDASLYEDSIPLRIMSDRKEIVYPPFLFATTSQLAYCEDFCYVPFITSHLFLGGWKA